MQPAEASAVELEPKLVAAFKGLKFLPSIIAIGKNNLNPKLILRRHDFEYRNTFWSTTEKYDAVETVDVYLKTGIFSTTNVCLYFKNSIFTFSGGLKNKESLKEVLRVFKSKHCKLSAKAEELLKEAN